MGAADYGIAGAAPLIVAGSDALTIATLVTQATSVSTEVSRRSTAVSGTSPSTVAAMVTGLQGIFGKDLVVCPRLIVSARTAALATGLQSTSALTLGAPSGVRGWLARSAQVRPGAARLTALLAEREVVALAQGATPSALQVAQFPLIANDRWIGLPSAPGTTVAGGRTGLVVHALSAIDPTQPLVGLAIDDWVETVPNQAETTALSFHFSAPSACAPQALLLALPKTMQSAWTLDGLIQNIQQARNLAKMRSVGPDLLTALGQPLPVAVVPYNTANDTASCPLWQLTP
jgi:hypothetical protein